MSFRVKVLLGFVLAMALAGCGGGTSSVTPAPVGAGATPGTGTPVATPTPSPPPTPGSTAPDASAIAITPRFSLDLPAGWVATRSQVIANSGSVCLAPRDDSQVVFDCAGIAIYFGAHLPGAHVDAYRPNQGDGWYPATDVEPCPFVTQKPGTLVGIETKAGFARGLRPVGKHRADWNRWTAGCAGRTFHPQAWFLPTSKIVVFDYLEHPQTAAVLGSARFAADGDQLPAMPTYLTAHLVSVTGDQFVVQPFHTYLSDAAGKAYAKAHHLDYPFPNDYYDADSGPTRTITKDVGTVCTGNGVLSDAGYDAPVTCSAFTGHAGLPLAIWIPAGSTTASSIGEMFRP